MTVSWRGYYGHHPPVERIDVLAWINVTVVLLLPAILYWGAIRELRSAEGVDDRALGTEELAD